MNKIYLILAHKSPEQLERQIKALYNEQSFFYIHIDLKSDIHLFDNLKKINNVYLITDRVDCIWGDFSTIIATLNLMENAINHHNEGFCILMSGHDYPIKNLSFIDAFFNQNKNTVFIDLDKAENIWPKFYERIKYYKINLSSKRGDFLLIKGLNTHTIKSLVKKEISFYQFLKIMVIKRKLTLPLKFYGGSQWWAMDLSILAKMNDYIKLNRHALFNFFVDSLLPDEFFFHSIIMYLKETGLPIEFDNSLTYINWSRKNCPLPVTFQSDDLKELLDQPPLKLFARKFDIDYNKEILDMIDQNIK